MQLLGTSRRWARVAAPRPGGRRPSELHFFLRPARPYLPCTRGSAQKLKTRRQYAPDSSAGRSPTRLPGVSGARQTALPEGIADHCSWRAAAAIPPINPISPPRMFATCGLPGYALGRARPKASPTAVKATAKSKVTPTSVPMRKRSSSVIEGEVNAAATASFVQYAGEKSAAV